MKHFIFSPLPRRDNGFTLIELLVVVVILGILAGLIVPRIMDRPDDARVTQAKIQIKSLETALQLYKLDNGAYPTTDQGLDALVIPPADGSLARKWRTGGYLAGGQVPLDPWGTPYIYIAPGVTNEFDLLSHGADKKPGGEGNDADILNWEIR